MAGHHKRVKSFNIPDHAHELTFSCFHGLKLLDRDQTRRWFVDALESTRTKHGLHLWAYVIMPEHVHVLFWPTGKYEIRAIRSSLKLPVAQRAIRFLKSSAPNFLERLKDEQPNGMISYRFWQRGGGYDRNVIEPGNVEKMVDYIHNNPVRRGLVADPCDWIWSSARFYQGWQNVPIRMDPLPDLIY
jgi:putative transposase